MIELKHLGKTYRTADQEIVALDDINLTIHDGEIFGIIGLSGAGKSTLVRCINLLEVPTSGEVLVDGKSLTALSRSELLKLRQSIGMIFQGFNLLEQRTVLRNVCVPLEIAGVRKQDAKKRARELLDLVGLSDRENSYPSQLSGGQKQRVAIARALATNPKYILCDEATSALDPNTTRAILDLLRKINEELGVTIVVITHEMKVVDHICDRVAVIDRSHIAEEGKVSDVFSNFFVYLRRVSLETQHFDCSISLPNWNLERDKRANLTCIEATPIERRLHHSTLEAVPSLVESMAGLRSLCIKEFVRLVE